MKDLRAYQYKRLLEERRGHNYQYINDEQYLKNEKLGYKYHRFEQSSDRIFESISTMNEKLAKEVVRKYRSDGYFSRIVCHPNEIIGAKDFYVIYRKKKI